MSRSARLFDLLQILRRHRRPASGQSLAEELGVSIRTLYRDIETLRGQGAPIEGEAGLGYVLRPGFVLPPLMFSENEVEAIVLGLRFVAKRGDDEMVASARDALAKIGAILPEELEPLLRQSGLMAGPGGSGDRARLSLIRKAIRASEKLRLDYVDLKGQASDRVVWPVAIAFFDEVEMLAAWCETRGAFRHFRFDRIREVAATGEKAPKPHRTLMAEWRRAQKLEHLL